jgi:glucokinase
LQRQGAKIAGAVWDDESLTVTAKKAIPNLSHLGPDAVISRIADLVRELGLTVGLKAAEIPGVGVGVPATFDMEKGLIWLIPNLPGDWYDKPIVALLRDMLGCPIYLVNDARAFTLAEATIGAGRGAVSCVGITLGTGIGGGIAINGHLYLGVTGTAGEFGHHSIHLHPAPDGSGNPGGWEGMANGPAIASMGMRFVAQGITTKIGELVNFDLNQITPEIIARAAELGDPIAKQILETAGFYLGDRASKHHYHAHTRKSRHRWRRGAVGRVDYGSYTRNDPQARENRAVGSCPNRTSGVRR